MRPFSVSPRTRQTPLSFFFAFAVLCLLLTACSTDPSSTATTNTTPCTTSCTVGPGVQGVQVFVEPDAGEQIITSAIKKATQSIWVEVYLLSDTQVLHALENAAHSGIDVRVMLELHPYGSGPSPQKTLDQLTAAGVKTQGTSPDFKLTHEKGIIIDKAIAFIMTANLTRSALGGSGSITNREYGIIDTNKQDVQSMLDIFNADWNHSALTLNNPHLVVSPVNSRDIFTKLINGAKKTLLIEAEEMQDSAIERAIANAAQRGVQVQVILPSAQSASVDDNNSGINVIKQGGTRVKEDQRLYMHAKIFIADGQTAFVGSENISTSSLEANREVGLLVSDATVLNTLQQTFQQDWNDSRDV